MSYFWFIAGAVVGSFLNVLIYRLPRGESIILPPSHCPSCGKSLSPLDLVPILGYFLLFGKCRYCRTKISFRYPLVELLSGANFALIWIFTNGNLFNFFFQALFLSVLIVIFFTDLEQQVIPDEVSVLGIFSGLIYHYFRGIAFPKGFNPFLSSLFGMLLGYILLYGIGVLGKLIFKKEAMGEGDLYLAALLGANLGVEGVMLSLLLAYFLAAAVAMVLLILGKIKIGQYIPFGPALAVGGVITLFFGKQMVSWYFSLFL